MDFSIRSVSEIYCQIFRKVRKLLWIHDLSWECVIKNIEDDQNILVSWVADEKENLLSLADLCTTSLENNIF